MNSQINLFHFVNAITAAIPNVPIRFKDEYNLVFRGELVEIRHGKAAGVKTNFTFDSPENLLKGLRDYGLRLKSWEVEKIISKYHLSVL